MRLLVNSSSTYPWYSKYPEWFGWLYTPTSLPFALKSIQAKTILPCYADNEAYKGLNKIKFMRMISLLQPNDIQWLVMPDAVGNAEKTTKYFHMLYPSLRRFKLAYVLQDNVTPEMIPYDLITTVFVGGSTEFKMSAHTLDLCKDAKMKGKNVHVGRVGSIKRLKHFLCVADTIDGSGWSRFADYNLPKYIRFMKELTCF